MKDKMMYITKEDARQLRKLFEVEEHINEQARQDLQKLQIELERSEVIDSRDVPQDVITMNSKVHLLDLDTEEEMIYNLVYPDDADIDQDKISVLAPIGVAMLGHRIGDIFEWPVPAGLRRLKVKEILYQPERS